MKVRIFGKPGVHVVRFRVAYHAPIAMTRCGIVFVLGVLPAGTPRETAPCAGCES